MSVQVEKLEKSMAKLTIEVEADKLEHALNEAYQKSRNKIAIPGFRKGKATRAVIEKIYGEGAFYQDAANILIPDAYEEAAKESGLEIVAQPEIDVETIKQGEPFVFTAVVAIRPEVTLGEYKGIEFENKDIEVTDEELDEELNRVREANSRMIHIDDRATKEGDTVTIDFDGTIDGESFEGGYAEDYSLVLGSHTFIEGFEEQLIGKNINDEFDVNVTFPENYQAEELQGRDAVFHVFINEISEKELPELDDELAQDVSDFDTLDEYKEDLKKKLFDNKELAFKREKEDDIVGQIIENATMEIPEQMVDNQANRMAQEFAMNIQNQGLSFEQYMQFTGMTPQAMMDEIKPQALKRIQSRLVLEAIADAENIEVSQEEFDEEIKNMADSYQMDLDKLKENMTEEEEKQIKSDIAVQKAVDLVVAAAVEK